MMIIPGIVASCYLLLSVAPPLVADGSLQIPLSVLISVGIGLCSCIAFVFKLLVVSHNRRADDDKADKKQLIEQLLKERDEAAADREDYSQRMEALVREKNEMHTEFIKICTMNTEAIRQNTAAREASNIQVSHLIPEITATCILKMFELGFLANPPKSLSPTPKTKTEAT